MEAPFETVVYADDATRSVYWLHDDRLVLVPLLSDGTFNTEGAAELPTGPVMAQDRAAHDKRIQAALHRADGRPDLAEDAEREARFHDGCADRNEAACMGHRELGGVKPPVQEDRIVRMTIQPGANRAPGLIVA